MIDRETAEKLVDQFADAIIMADEEPSTSNNNYAQALRAELIQFLIGERA